MEAIIIKSENAENLKLLVDLAKKLGEEVSSLDAEQAEDFALGVLMSQERTGEEVSRDAIMNKLRS
jgi:hypothetical protein